MTSTMSRTGKCADDLERRERAFRERGLTERIGDMERRIEFMPGYDHRAFPEDCGGGGHGQHGMDMTFLLIGPHGAVQWKASMPQWVPGSVTSMGNVPIQHPQLDDVYAADLGYHSPTPRHDGQRVMECDLLPGGKCYYDGSGLNAGPVLEKFISHGPGAVWAELANYYSQLFGSERERSE